MLGKRPAGAPAESLAQAGRLSMAAAVPAPSGWPDQARFLRRRLSLPVSTMSQWWVRRSSRAVVIFALPNTLVLPY